MRDSGKPAINGGLWRRYSAHHRRSRPAKSTLWPAGHPGAFSHSMNRSSRTWRWIARPSHQLDPCVMTGRSGETSITCEQRSIERFGKGDVGGIIGREIVSQIPDTRQKESVRISMQGKIREVGESRTATFAIDFSLRRISPDHLRDFDVEQMRCVQCLSRVE